MSTPSSGNFFLKKLKYLDAYPKTLEDFRVKTFSGAAISISCFIFIIILFIYEFQAFLIKEIKQELFVDVSRGQKFNINIDVTFPNLPCKIISIDSMDISGAMQIDTIKSVKKRRLNAKGHDITDLNRDRAKRNGEVKTTTTTLAPDACLSCYGAESEKRKCCNTCDEVKAAYREKNWQFSPHGVEQCKEKVKAVDEDDDHQHGTMTDEDMQKVLDSGEGCRLIGYLEVNKVAGNFHISPGSSHQQDSSHIHDIKLSQITMFNTSHSIKRFYFGQDLYPDQVNPLENLVQLSSEQKAIAYYYFIKIVPTTYQYSNGDLLNNTFQYSVTKHTRPIGQFAESMLPGFFVTYELSPIMVKFIEKQRSFTHFLTSCCAIVGGLFTVAGLLDAFVYRYYNIYKKSQLNKLT